MKSLLFVKLQVFFRSDISMTYPFLGGGGENARRPKKINLPRVIFNIPGPPWFGSSSVAPGTKCFSMAQLNFGSEQLVETPILGSKIPVQALWGYMLLLDLHTFELLLSSKDTSRMGNAQETSTLTLLITSTNFFICIRCVVAQVTASGGEHPIYVITRWNASFWIHSALQQLCSRGNATIWSRPVYHISTTNLSGTHFLHRECYPHLSDVVRFCSC